MSKGYYPHPDRGWVSENIRYSSKQEKKVTRKDAFWDIYEIPGKEVSPIEKLWNIYDEVDKDWREKLNNE